MNNDKHIHNLGVYIRPNHFGFPLLVHIAASAKEALALLHKTRTFLEETGSNNEAMVRRLNPHEAGRKDLWRIFQHLSKVEQDVRLQVQYRQDRAEAPAKFAAITQAIDDAIVATQKLDRVCWTRDEERVLGNIKRNLKKAETLFKYNSQIRHGIQ